MNFFKCLLAVIVFAATAYAFWFYAPLPPTEVAAQRHHDKYGGAYGLGVSSTPSETWKQYVKEREEAKGD